MRCLLIDKIIAWEKGSAICGVKNVTMSENFLQDHFPGFPVMPGVLQIEAVLQLASWLVFASTGGTQKAALVSMQSVKFKEFVVPGDQMRIQIDCTAFDETGAGFNAGIFVDDKLKTEIRKGRLAFVAVSSREDPQQARAHFDFLSGKAPMGAYEFRKDGYL